MRQFWKDLETLVSFSVNLVCVLWIFLPWYQHSSVLLFVIIAFSLNQERFVLLSLHICFMCYAYTFLSPSFFFFLFLLLSPFVCILSGSSGKRTVTIFDNFSIPAKLFLCELCGMKLSTREARRRHILAKHIKERKNFCKTCGKAFIFKLWDAVLIFFVFYLSLI